MSGRRWGRVPLLVQIYVLVGALVALVLATAAGSFVFGQRTENAMSHLTDVVRPAQTSASELTRAYTDQSDSVRGFLLTADQSFLQSDAAGQGEVARWQATLSQQLAGDPASVHLLAEINDAAQAWRSTFATPEINAIRSGVRGPGLDQFPAVTPPIDTPGEQRFEVLRARLGDLESHISQTAIQEATEIDSTRAMTDRFAAAISVLAIGLAVSTIFFLRRALTQPLTTLVTEVSEVAEGNLDRPVHPHGPPELAATASAVERMRQAQQRLVRYEEGERIARGLHDQVIQRLIAAGMMLQLTASRHPELAQEVSESIGDLERTLKELRAVIFGLTNKPNSGAGIRERVLEVVRDSERSLGFAPQVRFHGVTDAVATVAITEELLPALQESLSNIARHAQARRADVSLTATDQELILQVTDDGVGVDITHVPRGQGLNNLRTRAERLGGTCTLNSAASHGTTVDWRVPLAAG